MSFDEYYEKYLTLHQNKWNRRLHFLGVCLTIDYICACFYFDFLWGLLATPFIVYPFAWIGHLFLEKNKPAAWSNPIKAKICDWLMIRDIIRGKIKW